MNETAAREEICRIGRSLYQRGYAHASAGNISMRLDEGLLITPTDSCLGSLQPQELVRIS
ncbi:MAG: aldolase, partial [Betaproteobacteria bacterium]